MSTGHCTALILLPVAYNPDARNQRGLVPFQSFLDTILELEKLLGLGCTLDPHPKLGIWERLGALDEDTNVLIEIDLLPLRKRGRLVEFCRERLLDRFQQEAILLRFIPVTAIVVTRRVDRKEGGR